MGAPVNLLNRVTISPHMRVAPLPQDHLALLDARADMIRTRRMLYHKETALHGAVTARIIAGVPGYRGPTGGTGVTPGHVFLCGAGRFAGRHVPLIDILRDDGAVVWWGGGLMRTSTGEPVGFDGGRLNEVVAADRTKVRQRAGTRVPGKTGAVTCWAKLTGASSTPRCLQSQRRHVLTAMAEG